MEKRQGNGDQQDLEGSPELNKRQQVTTKGVGDLSGKLPHPGNLLPDHAGCRGFSSHLGALGEKRKLSQKLYKSKWKEHTAEQSFRTQFCLP